MNAPWKPGGPGNRDPFAAYICDDAALDALRPVAIEMGWAPEKCNKGGLRHAVQSLSVTASPNILMVDLSESGDPLNDINSLAEVCEPGTVVIAIGQVNDVRLYRDLIASGIHDYLLKPLSAPQLRDAFAQAQAVFSSPRSNDVDIVKRHTAVTVVGSRGGVGSSTLATSLAWIFSAERHIPTALLDLDVHFGTGALVMDLEPGRGLTDAIDNPGRIDGLFIERAMVRANDNLAILSAEAPINNPLMTDGSAFVQLMSEFRQSFEVTVTDMPRNMLINFPNLLTDSNVVVLGTEMTLASARDTIRLLSWLKTHAAHAQPVIVSNKFQPGANEISKSDFEASIEHKVDITIPYDLKVSCNAAKLGQSFAEAAKSSKTGQALHELADRVLGASEDEGSVSTGKKSLLGNLDLKALLGAKGKGKEPRGNAEHAEA